MTARLAQILAEEVDLLQAMNVSKIGDLQEEKLYLVSALEARKKLIQKNPHLIKNITSGQREELRKVYGVFDRVMQENYRKLQLAKQVNQKIIDIIRQVARDATMSGVYNGFGQAYAFAHNTLSLTLNKRI